MGKGAILSGSLGQKSNTKSSTETEIIGVDQYLPTVLWSKYFIEEQGYTIENTIIHQDNESTIRLLVNGRLSGSKRTKHIKAKYYLAKDYSDRGEIKFSYLPTTPISPVHFSHFYIRNNQYVFYYFLRRAERTNA